MVGGVSDIQKGKMKLTTKSNGIVKKQHLPCGTWEFTLVGPLWLKVDPLVIGESCSTAKPLTADLADKGIILLVDFDMSLKVVDCGETPPTAFKLTGMWPLLVMGLKMPL